MQVGVPDLRPGRGAAVEPPGEGVALIGGDALLAAASAARELERGYRRRSPRSHPLLGCAIASRGSVSERHGGDRSRADETGNNVEGGWDTTRSSQFDGYSLAQYASASSPLLRNTQDQTTSSASSLDRVLKIA